MSMTIICGKTGKGKTALMTELLARVIAENGFSDYMKCKKEIIRLVNGGFTTLTPPTQRHVCYADYDVKLSKFCKTYHISGFEIGLPNLFFKTRYIPPYATIFLDEAQKYFDSRISMYLREEVYRWFQLHRHNHYNIYMTCQRLANIDVNIRAIADYYIVVEDIKVKTNEWGQVTNIEWRIRKFESCETAERYQMAKESEKFSNLGVAEVIKTDLPIFSYYNSYGCKPAFYKSVDFSNVTFDYYTEDGYEFTLESFTEFNNNHYFVCPTGYLKNAKRDKEILESLGGCA